MQQNEVSVDQLKGRHVIDKSGIELGAVEDVTFDRTAMQVTGLIVKVNRDASDRLRLDRPVLGNARVQISTERVDTIGDNVLLNVEGRDMAAILFDTGA